MIELIIGIVAAIVAIVFAIFAAFAASMSDSPSSTNSFLSSYLWTVAILLAVTEAFLLFIWFAKHKGWS